MHNVIKKFWKDPYLTKSTAKVTSVDGNKITVDQTIAYAFSGGQESDYGRINQYTILKAEKCDKEIFYFIENSHELQTGDEVVIQIEWERRYKLMKLHFAAEIILELMNQKFNNPDKIGAHISADKARVDFVWQGNISETFSMLQTEVARLVEQDLSIISEFSDLEREVRYWEVENFAKVSCGGTHLKKTGELGSILLKRNNIGKGKERIEITLG